MSTFRTVRALVRSMLHAVRSRLSAVVLTVVVLFLSLQTAASLAVEVSLVKRSPDPARVAQEVGRQLEHFVPPSILPQLAALPLSSLTAHVYFTVLLPWLALAFALAATDGLAQALPSRRVMLQVASACAGTLCVAALLSALQVVLANALLPDHQLGARGAAALASTLGAVLEAVPAAALGAFVSGFIRNRLLAFVAALPLLLGLRWFSPLKLTPLASFFVPPMFRVQPIDLGDPAFLRAAVASVLWSIMIASAAVLTLRFRAAASVTAARAPQRVATVVPSPSQE